MSARPGAVPIEPAADERTGAGSLPAAGPSTRSPGRRGTRSPTDAGGDAVLAPLRPAGLVGRVRRQRPRPDPGRRGRGRPGRDRRHRAADAPPRGGAGRRGGAHDASATSPGRSCGPCPARRPPSSSGPPTTPTTPRSWPRRPTCRRSCEARGRLPAPAQDPVALGRGRPAPPALRRPGRRRAGRGLRGPRRTAGWVVTREQEDVCPVVDPRARPRLRGLPRHAGQEGAPRDPAQGPPGRGRRRGPPRAVGRPGRDLDAFVDLHQKRWGAEGLFPPTEGGAASRRFFAGCSRTARRTASSSCSFLTVGGRRIAAGVTFDDGETVYYYNAGVDPDARELSPGVVMVAALHPASHRARPHPPRLPARRRALQVRVGRGGRANPAPARPATTGPAAEARQRCSDGRRPRCLR